MKLSLDETNIINAYRDGAYVDVVFHKCSSYEDASDKLTKNGFGTFEKKAFEDGNVMLYTDLMPTNRIEAHSFYETEYNHNGNE
ncbi:hypothetical protein FOL01_0439 [Weissella jogaejeotgali]|uniref:Uncharacterized protein n=1 Tax=Weissella jogaejeotgali TaxID=1631871 RepID=A0A1L6R9W5_9LACO|nr:hypothetical protein [Weissella jogaejeotgali]APS41298.1 hypothetical protein FOL01_0439 [Weissella jogaejeotgali]